MHANSLPCNTDILNASKHACNLFFKISWCKNFLFYYNLTQLSFPFLYLIDFPILSPTFYAISATNFLRFTITCKFLKALSFMCRLNIFKSKIQDLHPENTFQLICFSPIEIQKARILTLKSCSATLVYHLLKISLKGSV